MQVVQQLKTLTQHTALVIGTTSGDTINYDGQTNMDCIKVTTFSCNEKKICLVADNSKGL